MDIPYDYPLDEEETEFFSAPRRIRIPLFMGPLAALMIGAIFTLVFSSFTIAKAVYPNSGLSTQKGGLSPVAATQVVQPVLASSISTGAIAPLFTPQIQHWSSQIVSWSQKWGLDPNLVATIMQIESCGDPNAQSRAGAMGLFQVMPFHFVSNEDGFDPQTNAKRGLSYLNEALNKLNGDARLALAGYNSGIGGASRPESDWPAETLRYVYWGTGIYADAQQSKTQSDRLDEWLNTGGASLCTQASQALGINP